MNDLSPRARHRLRRPVSLLALIAALAFPVPAPLLAQDGAGGQIAQAEAPAEWQRGDFLDVRYAVPPGWTEVQRDDESFIFFGGDMATRTGPAFGLRLIDDIAEFLDAAPPESRPVLFAGGRRFDRYAVVQEMDGIRVEGDLLISAEPYWQGKFLAVSLLAYNGALADHAGVFGQVLAAIGLPAANEIPRQGFLRGAFRIATPGDWDVTEGDSTITFERRKAMGFVRVSRHPGDPEQGHLNKWIIPSSAVARPVTMLGQPALLYEWEERKSMYHDGSDDPQITRVYVYETCAEGPDTLAVEISGLPSFHASAELNELLDQVAVEAGLGPCGPANLPPGAVPGTPGARTDGRAGLVPAAGAAAPAAPTEEVKGTALGGLVSYTAPPGWFAMSGMNTFSLIHPDGRGFVTVARGAGVLAPGGIVGQMPPDRMGSFFSGHYQEWTEIGWPPASAEFMDGGKPAEGWHFVRIARECLPGQEPVAIHYAGIDRFRNGETLQTLLNGLTFHWPDAMEECRLKDAGYGETAPQPAPEPEPAPEPVPQPDPAPAPQATAPLAPPPPPVAAQPEPVAEPDSFTEGDAGYTLYRNARYGTFISYPGSYYIPEPAPGNGDGRTFVSADGASRFFVFAQYDAFGMTQDEMMQQDEAIGGYDDVTYRRSGEGWYVLSGHVGADIFYRRVILDPSGLVQVFQITYPTGMKDSFDPVVTYMADSFGPGASAAPVAEGAWEPSPDPAWDDEFPATPVRVDRLTTPARNTDLRRALMNTARPPIEAAVGRDIVFVVSVLRTDGHWAYLQAVPHNPDGSRINWARTPFAREMKEGVMSDVAMVLMRKLDDEWTVVDHVFGPSDVYWLNWANAYQLDQALFMP